MLIIRITPFARSFSYYMNVGLNLVTSGNLFAAAPAEDKSQYDFRIVHKLINGHFLVYGVGVLNRRDRI